ncbi:MAG: hypothetical protein IPL61_05170 [Myxococcales bacterium]|nr:hypothetical protein [Myxococcales bacterium]
MCRTCDAEFYLYVRRRGVRGSSVAGVVAVAAIVGALAVSPATPYAIAVAAVSFPLAAWRRVVRRRAQFVADVRARRGPPAP